ncbi:MAG: carbohydrate binding family 9 domain-containing protein [Terracidiphilus sp.]
MRYSPSGVVLAAALVLVPLAAAHTGKQERPAAPPQSQTVREATVPLLTEGLRLADFPDMAPRPELKTKLAHVGGFIQSQPKDGEPPTEQTEVWLGYTRSTIYFVFICHDRTPAAIRSHLARRENVQNDDNVSVLLDTFQDRRKGVLFMVNPAGVQADAAWDENGNMDFSYDQVWDSEGRIGPGGWMALIAIPFRSLRFRAGHSDWGVVFNRSFPRNSESDFWPRVAASVTGVLSQEGTLHGIAGVTGSRNLQLNPYVLGQNERTLNTLDPTNPYFSSRRFESTAGGEAKVVLRDSIVVDGTINPDFSDVESDQPQFTVNQRYPVYFPELRPFFLENANYFATPIQLVYTRNIVHPEYGIRVTGKLGHTNLGFFAIDDREPGQTVVKGDPLYKQRAKFAVGRVSEDLGKGSSIGLIYTDEEFGGGWNRIGGADFTWRMNDSWTTRGQWIESSTMGDRDSGNPPTYSAGPAAEFDLQRNGHAFNLYENYDDFSSGFVTQLGFIQTANIHSNHTHATYQWYPKHSKLQSWGLEANQNISFDHAGNRVLHYSTFDPFFLLPRNTVIAPIGGQNSDTLGPQNTSALTHNRNFTENWGGFVLRSSPSAQLTMNIVAARSGNVNYNPATGAEPSLMNQQFVQAFISVQPLRQLTTDNTYLLDRDRETHGNAFVYESQTFRTKMNYQFTRSFSARVIAQYQSTLVNPAQTSLLRTKQISTQALVTWLPHPGTAIYLGYNNDLQNLDRSLCNRLPGGACDPNNTTPPRALDYLNDGKQFFLKASYLFRF